MLKHLSVILFLIFLGQYGFCQTTDTVISQTENAEKRSFFRRIYQYFEDANETKEDKRFDFSIIGGPHYASDTKLGLGLVASGLYRLDRTDKTLSPSNLSLYGDVTTTGFYLLGVSGNTIFRKDKYRINMDLYFFSFPSKYWGIGYTKGNQENHYTNYKRLEEQVKFDFLKSVAKYTYIGISTQFRNVNAKNFKDKSFLAGENSTVTSFGMGLFVNYDSRDFIPNPSRGVYAKIEQTFFPDFFGNKYAFQRSEITARYYKNIWKGGTLASELIGTFNYGDPPWTMVALLGSAYRMRGYYEGQYRDNDLIQAQVEIRQKIYNRHGAAIWIGAGNVFHDFQDFKWSETLPTYGLGYRWEFKKRINIRLDYGFGKGQSAFYFNVNEAF